MLDGSGLKIYNVKCRAGCLVFDPSQNRQDPHRHPPNWTKHTAWPGPAWSQGCWLDVSPEFSVSTKVDDEFLHLALTDPRQLVWNLIGENIPGDAELVHCQYCQNVIKFIAFVLNSLMWNECWCKWWKFYRNIFPSSFFWWSSDFCFEIFSAPTRSRVTFVG